jgi:transcription elongation factor Elf1
MQQQFVKDSGWQNLRGTVERCGSCGRSTVHLTARGGVAVCGQCGYSPAFEQFEEEREPERDDSWIVHLPRRSWRRK